MSALIQRLVLPLKIAKDLLKRRFTFILEPFKNGEQRTAIQV